MSAADQAWDAVLAYVQAAPDGTKLPPERELADRLGVSRSTLRSAISRAEGLGLIAVRHGSGMVVRRPTPVRLLESLLGWLPVEPDARSALPLRALLEPHFAAEVARSRAPTSLTDRTLRDDQFHLEIAGANANELATAVLGLLIAATGDIELDERLHRAQHVAVAAAIEAGDTAAARDAMSVHMRSLARAAGSRR